MFCFLYSLGVLIYYIAFEEDAQVQAAPTGGYLKPPVIVRKIYLTFTLFLFYNLLPDFFQTYSSQVKYFIVLSFRRILEL